MNLLEHNRLAWNQENKNGNVWTIPVQKADLEATRRGDFTIVLTPYKPVPREWLGELQGKKVLGLASGGGQQGPILAAAGAQVTVFDNSEEQLKKDQELSEQYDLNIVTVQGNMQDLSIFGDRTFDLIIHPVSNCYIDNILPVWKESYRVLKINGELLAGFSNPLIYMINWADEEKSEHCELKYSIPYSDINTLSAQMKKKYAEESIPFEFGHSLTDQIQGQIGAGFMITGFYEDKGNERLDRFTDVYIATRAIKSG